MSGIVVFDAEKFLLRYPEFSSVIPDRLQLFFDDATSIVDNSECSRISNVSVRERILFALTAHIAYRAGALNSGGVTGSVAGQLASASQGSVSVSFNTAPLKTLKSAWYQSSPYGQDAWLLMKPWMSFIYITGGADTRF